MATDIFRSHKLSPSDWFTRYATKQGEGNSELIINRKQFEEAVAAYLKEERKVSGIRFSYHEGVLRRYTIIEDNKKVLAVTYHIAKNSLKEVAKISKLRSFFVRDDFRKESHPKNLPKPKRVLRKKNTQSTSLFISPYDADSPPSSRTTRHSIFGNSEEDDDSLFGTPASTHSSNSSASSIFGSPPASTHSNSSNFSFRFSDIGLFDEDSLFAPPAAAKPPPPPRSEPDIFAQYPPQPKAFDQYLESEDDIFGSPPSTTTTTTTTKKKAK